MDLMTENAPCCFSRTDVAPDLKSLYFVSPVWMINTKDTRIGPLVHVLADVFDALDIATHFQIDVTLESTEEEGTERDNKGICYFNDLVSLAFLKASAAILW